jgi:PAS domain S-box-containing protein
MPDLQPQNQSPEATSLLAAIVNSSDDAIVSKSLDGIIRTWNDGARRIFGYEPEEIIGQPVIRLIPLNRQDEEPRILERLRRGERVDHFETIRVRKNGEHFPVSLTISPVKGPDGRIIGASKIARDISELRRISQEREQLLESERAARMAAETANRMKDEFLSTVSHELRTPLNAIVGWTEVIEIGALSPEEVRKGVEVIKRNALMQAQLIEDLLDLGRISSGKMTLNLSPVDVAQIIRDALAAIEHAAQAKRITIKTMLGDVRGVLGDAKRLQQVLGNVLTNAVKFTPENGKVTLSTSRVNSHIEIAITDTGKGIAPSFLPQLFERFRQADSSSTRRHGGLGIGLALVKQLTELHGGSVRAYSAGENLGATFTICLPVAALQEDSHSPIPTAADPSAAALADLHGIKVMAVDDDQDSLQVIKRILLSRNAEVQTATSVPEAVALFSKFSPDVLLSDIGMPGQDGYELIRQIRELPGGRSVPAAALTALARSEDRTRALTAGFQSHISKPVAAAEVVAMVRSLANLSAPRG